MEKEKKRPKDWNLGHVTWIQGGDREGGGEEGEGENSPYYKTPSGPLPNSSLKAVSGQQYLCPA